MLIGELSDKWLKLEEVSNKNNLWVYLNLNNDTIPNLNIAINNKNNRCILLKTEKSYNHSIKEILKENIKFNYSKLHKQYVLELLDDSFSDLFDELILSLYNKTNGVIDEREATSTFINTIKKWMLFFNKGTNTTLSEKVIRGLYGELIVLKEYLLNKENMYIDDILLSWQGPFNAPTDFVFEDILVEVKTKLVNSNTVKISSEHQLERVDGKGLVLKVVTVEMAKESIDTLETLFKEIKEIIILNSGDLGLLISCLNNLGITTHTIKLYNHLKYSTKTITEYDCLLLQNEIPFPRFSKENIPQQITKIKYDLNLYSLDNYIVNHKEF